jgi:hypothetical protein
MRNINFVALFALIFVSLNTFGQNQVKLNEVLVDKFVTMYSNDGDTCSVILLDNDSLVVKTSLNVIQSEVAKRMKGIHTNNDKKLYGFLLEATNNGSINAYQIAKTNDLTHRLKYLVAGLLENGQCFVYSKKENKRALKVRIQSYSYSPKPINGVSFGGYVGRRFFIDNQLILDVLDGIS